jgi:multidrug resistance efflux pump
MSGAGRIPIPWKHRWRRFRYGMLPLVGMVACAAATLYLWGQQGLVPQTIGEVEALRVDVTAATDGALVPLAGGQWSLYDEVEFNQVVAQLDDAPVRAQLATLTEELARLRKELEAAAAKLAVSEADRARDHQADVARLQVEAEQRRLAVLDRRIQVETDTLELGRLNARVSCLTPLFAKKLIAELEIKNEKALRDEAAKRLAANTKSLGEAETQLRVAEQRVRLHPPALAADSTKELAPIAAAAAVQQARIREVELSATRLAIRAPIRGVICAVLRRPGETVRAGDPILTLAADSGRYIVSYVRQEHRFTPHIGMPVEVRALQTPISPPLVASVERIGPQLEAIPQHQCRDPRIPEWGLPVRIALPRGCLSRPGELLEVTFKPHAKNDG